MPSRMSGRARPRIIDMAYCMKEDWTSFSADEECSEEDVCINELELSEGDGGGDI